MIVLDASAAFEIAMFRPKREIFLEFLTNDSEIVAPEFFIAECTNVAWKYLKTGYFESENEAKLTLTYVLQMVTKYTCSADYSIEVLHEANRLNHAAYNMYYYVLARDNVATLLTVDEKLAKICRENGVNVA